MTRPFAVITGGASGIGYALAQQFLDHDFDVLIAADQTVDQAVTTLTQAAPGASVEGITVDLATKSGVGQLYAQIRARPIDALVANAGIGLGHSFFDQSHADWLKLIETNIIGTLDLIHLVGRDMRARGEGRILITSSIASQAPSPYLALYAASKSFLQSFSFAIRNELRDSGVTVTALLPGGTDSDIWDRAGVTDTKLGASAHKADPADVAKAGFEALMLGDGQIVPGIMNKLAAVASKFVPGDLLTASVSRTTRPGSAK